jgi:hypothetical protein
MQVADKAKDRIVRRQDLRVWTILDSDLAVGVHDSDTHLDFSLS